MAESHSLPGKMEPATTRPDFPYRVNLNIPGEKSQPQNDQPALPFDAATSKECTIAPQRPCIRAAFLSAYSLSISSFLPAGVHANPLSSQGFSRAGFLPQKLAVDEDRIDVDKIKTIGYTFNIWSWCSSLKIPPGKKPSSKPVGCTSCGLKSKRLGKGKEILYGS